MRVVVALSAEGPAAQGRTWDEAAYAERDAVLAALGVRAFGRNARQRT